MSRLLLVRHGSTAGNEARRFLGKTDVALSAEGIRQAEQLRDRLAAQRIDTVYTSDLSRARLTAEIIASGHQADITPCTELSEIDFGQLEGLTFDEMKRSHPGIAASFSDWQARLDFPGGESLDELDKRVQKFLNRLRKHQPEETILIVSHFSTLRLMVCDLLEIGVEHWRQLQLSLASLSIIETYPQGAVLNLLNDVSHLKLQE